MSARFSQPSGVSSGEQLRPIALLLLAPTDLEQQGVSFHATAHDGLDTAQAGLVELDDGRRFGLVKYDHAPVSGTEVLADEDSADVAGDLEDFLRALGLSDASVAWRLDLSASGPEAQGASGDDEPGVSSAVLKRAADLAERFRGHAEAARLVLPPRHGGFALSHTTSEAAQPMVEVDDGSTRVLIYVRDRVIEAEVVRADPAFDADEFDRSIVVELWVDGAPVATATVSLAVSPIGALGGRAEFLAHEEALAGPSRFDVLVRPGKLEP